MSFPGVGAGASGPRKGSGENSKVEMYMESLSQVCKVFTLDAGHASDAWFFQNGRQLLSFLK